MGELAIDDPDDRLKAALAARGAAHGRSVEAEAQAILEDAVARSGAGAGEAGLGGPLVAFARRVTEPLRRLHRPSAPLTLPFRRSWDTWGLLFPLYWALRAWLSVFLHTKRVPAGDDSSAWLRLLGALACTVLTAAFVLWRPRLVIDQDGVFLKTSLQPRRFAWDEIVDAQVVTTGPTFGLRVVEIQRRDRPGADLRTDRIDLRTMPPEDLVRLILEGRRRWGRAA